MPDSEDDGIPSNVRNLLLQKGINLSNAEIRNAVRETILIRAQAELEHLSTVQEGLSIIKRGTFYTFLLSSLGVISALLTLAAGFRPFIDAVRRLFSGESVHGVLDFISTAFAQTPQATTLAQSSAQLGPILVYGVYVLLALAYVVSLYNVFLGRDIKDKRNAMDMFKNLNAFFIGAISGRFV
jgi:hypothetical protein